MSEKDNSQNTDDNAKPNIRATRSDPLSFTSQNSHSIKSKHHHHSGYTSHPPSYTNYSHSKEQRRARWIRERMSANYKNPQQRHYHHDKNLNNHYSSEDNYYPIQGYHQSQRTLSSDNFDSSFQQSSGGPTGKECWCCHGNQQNTGQTQDTNSFGTRTGSTWMSENDSKANRFHRPYSLREQRSWTSTDNRQYFEEDRQHRHQRLRAGRSLPITYHKGNLEGIFEGRDEGDLESGGVRVKKASKIELGISENFGGDEAEDDDDDEEGEEEDGEKEEEEDEGENKHCYLSRQKKLPYPYCLKGDLSEKRRSSGENLRIGRGGEGEGLRRSRSGSPCSITSESTESLGECENALDPPHISLPNGDIGGGTPGGTAVPVSYGGPLHHGNGNGGRKFSLLFSSSDAWSEENIIQSFKELDPVANSIFEAAWTGNKIKVEEILREEENVRRLRNTDSKGFYRDGEGRTPLHLASAWGHVDVVKLLLEKGAPVNAVGTGEGETSTTPLSCAASCGSVPVVKVLLEGGACVNSGYEQDGRTALHWAVQCGSLEVARILLEKGAKQNPPKVYSETPLHVAAGQGDEECLKLLLDYGADVNLCRGANRSTALHLSSEEGSAGCVRLLLKKGANHQAKDIRGHTALHVAATCDADCVIALLKAGADPNAVDANGRTPLHCAVARGSRAAECVRLLVESGADIDAQDNYGYTPLHLSAVNESSQCASILLHHGSDVTLKTNAGTNALSLLVRRIPDVMRYLVDRLDSAVTIHDHDPGDPDCEVRLDFRAIVPNCEKKCATGSNGKFNVNGHGGAGGNGLNGVGGGKGGGGSDRRKNDYFTKPHKETEFLTCLLAAGNKKILAHPLSEAFLCLKWRRVRKFFWASLLFQIALVFLFTVYVVEVYLIRCPYRRGAYNNSGGDRKELETPSPPNTLLVMSPPRLDPPPGGFPHKLSRRSADPLSEPKADPLALAGFQWFGLVPPPKMNRSRGSKQEKIEETTMQVPNQPPSPTPRNRGRVNIILTPPNSAGLPQAPQAPQAPGIKIEEETYASERNPRMDPIECRLTPFLQVVWVLLVAFASLMAIKEVFQLIQSPLSYVVSSENWGQWLLISSVTVAAWTTSEFQLEYWQYPAAACGIFLAWGLMLLQVGRFPALGLYVQMLGKVAANFGLFILAYACLLIAFALAFCVLFPEAPPYSSVVLSILKVFTMMVGEVDYEDLFYNEARSHDPILFPLTAHLLYGAFVVIVTIVLMNLLVGLAVHDIQGLQKGAKLNRLSRQTALISRLESFIFSKKLQSILPLTLGSILQKSALLVPSSYNWSFYFRPNDPRDKRLPKDIKLSSLRLASSRHSCTKSKSSHHAQAPNHLSKNPHRNTHMACVGSSPTPFTARPSSSVSQHHNLHHHSTTPTNPSGLGGVGGNGGNGNSTTSLLFPNQYHPEFGLRRVEQRLDSLQSQLEKALLSLNGRIDLFLGAVKKPSNDNASSLLDNVGESATLFGKTTPISPTSTSSTSTTATCSSGSSKGSPSSLSPRRRIGGHPSILKDISTEKG